MSNIGPAASGLRRGSGSAAAVAAAAGASAATAHAGAPRPGHRPLLARDFLPLALNGWGDGWNAYVHSMAWFEDHLYCGTFRANLCLKRRQKVAAPQWPVWPIKCPHDVFKEIDLRAQIWRFSPARAEWQNVQRAPIVQGKDRQPIPRECGYRGMAVVQGRSDRKPVLYVTPFSNTRSTGPVILRSEDGQTFSPVSKPGLGYAGVSSFRFLAPFKNRLYTSPVGSTNNVVNQSKYPVVLESADPARGTWRAVSAPGFGDANNTVIFNMTEFDGRLYAGTFNHVDGFQLWKTEAAGTTPYTWRQVIGFGAGRGNLNEGVMSLCTFGGALYVGTCVQDGGYDRVNEIGPAAAELIRVYPDDSWDLVVGEARLTRHGFKRPTSGLGPGFDNPFNGYLWRLCVHDGRLYAGMLSWSAYLPYLDLDHWPAGLRRFVEARPTQDFLTRRSGMELWTSGDGDSWDAVTTNGFANPYNSGCRSLVSTPYGLAVGTVNAFGPQVAIKNGAGWRYVANPRGGAEVWLGAERLSAALRTMHPPGGQGHQAQQFRLGQDGRAARLNGAAASGALPARRNGADPHG
jgi:hypothetical protein